MCKEYHIEVLYESADSHKRDGDFTPGRLFLLPICRSVRQTNAAKKKAFIYEDNRTTEEFLLTVKRAGGRRVSMRMHFLRHNDVRTEAACHQ